MKALLFLFLFATFGCGARVTLEETESESDPDEDLGTCLTSDLEEVDCAVDRCRPWCVSDTVGGGCHVNDEPQLWKCVVHQ